MTARGGAEDGGNRRLLVEMETERAHSEARRRMVLEMVLADEVTDDRRTAPPMHPPQRTKHLQRVNLFGLCVLVARQVHVRAAGDLQSVVKRGCGGEWGAVSDPRRQTVDTRTPSPATHSLAPMQSRPRTLDA